MEQQVLLELQDQVIPQVLQVQEVLTEQQGQQVLQEQQVQVVQQVLQVPQV
jgi:hypothetical protein